MTGALTGWWKWIVGALIVIAIIAVAWSYGSGAFDRWMQARLRDQAAVAQKVIDQKTREAQDAWTKAAEAMKKSAAAEANAKKAEATAAALKQQADQQLQERQRLLAKLQATEGELQKIREEVARVPASQILASVRRVLDCLHDARCVAPPSLGR